jgi:hypothetical protein
LATNKEGQELVLTAAKLYYEDWTITSMEKLRAMDKKLHGMDGYLVSELIRQLVQIRIGELTSEEAKGTAWDKNRIFYVGRFGTTENLLKSMAGTLRQAVPKLVNLSPTLAEALTEIERTIQKIQLAQFDLQLNRRPARMQKAFPSRQDATEVQGREALAATACF